MGEFMTPEQRIVANTLRGTEFAKNWEWKEHDLAFANFDKVVGEVICPYSIIPNDELNNIPLNNMQILHGTVIYPSLSQLLDAIEAKGYVLNLRTHQRIYPTEKLVYLIWINDDNFDDEVEHDSRYMAVFKAFCFVYDIEIKE